jgi:pyruvate/2-oxoglutarate dehydrogenase complex dihydrolipoamide acyltransferase (E2) component
VEDVTLPKWGMTMQEGTIAAWQASVGDRVEEGQVIATVETEKVEAELEAPVSGVLAEILVEAGQTVEVGTLVARIESG